MDFPNVYQNTITIPTGATAGARIVIDGVSGQIKVYNSSNVLVDVIGGTSGPILSQDGSSRFTEMKLGQLLVGGYSGGSIDEADAAVFGYTVSGSNQYLTLVSPINNGQGFTDQCAVLLFSGKPNLGIGGTGSGNPGVIIIDEAASSAAWGLISGNWQRSDNSGNALTKQSPSYGSGWADAGYSGTSYPGVTFWKDTNDMLVFAGCFHSTGTHTTSPTVFTLPTGYIPKNIGRFSIDTQVSGGNPSNGSVGAIISNGTGAVILNTTASIATNTNFYLNGSVPMGDWQ